MSKANILTVVCVFMFVVAVTASSFSSNEDRLRSATMKREVNETLGGGSVAASDQSNSSRAEPTLQERIDLLAKALSISDAERAALRILLANQTTTTTKPTPRVHKVLQFARRVAGGIAKATVETAAAVVILTIYGDAVHSFLTMG